MRGNKVGGRIQWASWILAGVLLWALPAAGQLEVGDNLSMNLNGTLGVGYTADYANLFSSSHSLSGSGTGTLSGSYYNPNFLSYSVSPYYGQSRANSNYQSIFDSSGVNAAAAIFSGSHFPGSISYAKSYNSEGNFGVPGIANYTTRGNSDTFGINWSENLPDDPSLSVSFQRGSSEYSIFGTDQNGNSTFDSVNVHSGYQVHGFGLGAFYERGGSHSLVPQLVGTGEQPENVSSDNSGYGFSATHVLPLRGGFSSSVTRSVFDTGLAGENFNGSVDLITANAGIQPTDKLHLSVGANYSDSLTGQLFEQIVAAGGVAPLQNPNQSSHGMDVIGSGSYAITKGLQGEADVERRQQTYLGLSLGSNAYSGSLVYTTGFLGGNFNVAGTLRDITLDGSSQNNLGFSVTTNYTRRINEWVMSGSFNYAQNVQTLLITYMNSFYNYSGNIRHRWGLFTWNAGASAGRTALTSQSGLGNSNQSYSTSVGYSRYMTLTGSYSKGSGTGIETASGLVQNPVLVPLTPGSGILFAGDSYAIGLGSSPAKKLTISASYGRGNSNTNFSGVAQGSSTSQYNAIFQYQLRKIYVNGGYSRLQQGFTPSPTLPGVVSSFYFGISRWFNFF
jgi:hypothetical protein